MSQSQIQAFKLFLQERPFIIKEIRDNGIPLQEVYEQYILLGEEDPSWEQYNKEEQPSNKNDSKQLYHKLWKHVEQLDVDKVEEHIHQLNGAVHHIIKLIDQFKRQQQKTSTDNHSADNFFHSYD